MAYAEYEFYKDSYLGNAIPESEFPRLALRASEYIDANADTKQASPDQLRKACCSVAEVMQSIEHGGEVASQTVGKWSKTYARVARSDADRLMEAMKLHLGSAVGTVITWA